MPNPLIQCVSFDAAGTLLKNRYRPGPFAVCCAGEVGIGLPEEAGHAYEVLMGQRLSSFWEANQSRDASRLQDFWRQLTVDWLTPFGDEANAPLVIAEAERQMFESDRWFEVFEDTRPALHHLVSLGIPAIVLSNWDASLHGVLRSKSLTASFQTVIASLEHGVEKPDPRLFEIAEKQSGFAGIGMLHIGDDWTDDVDGAIRAGWHAGFLDRLSTGTSTKWLTESQLLITAPRLTDFVEVIASF